MSGATLDRLSASRQALADAEAAHAHAVRSLAALEVRRAESEAIVQGAASAATDAGVALAADGDSDADTDFQAATARLATAKARLEAFDGQVLPAARDSLAGAEVQLRSARGRLLNEQAREIVRQEVLPCFVEWTDLMAAAVRCKARLEEAASRVHGTLGYEGMTEQQRSILGHSRSRALAYAAPSEFRALFRDAHPGTEGDPVKALRNAFALGEEG